MDKLHIKIILGYIIIFVLICTISCVWYSEWNEVESLEANNQRIDELRKEVNRIHIRLIELSLSGETVLDWDEADLANYHAQRIALDSTLCLFNKFIRLSVLTACAVFWKIRNDRCSKLSG